MGRAFILLAGFAVVAASGAARADILELKNGGRVHGEIVGPYGDRTTYVVRLDGGGRVSIPQSEVSRVVRQTEAEVEYARRHRAAGDSVEAHLKLAEWCREQGLRDEFRRQMARVLELDPNHEEARSALGFQKHDGQWLTREQIMASRGLVLYDGKYHTPQHVELLEEAKQAKETGADWKNQLKRWRRWLVGRREDRAAEALQAIRSIRDQAAAPALVEMLRDEQDPAVQRLLIEVAARLDHPEAVEALVDLSLLAPNPDTRQECLDYLIKSERPGLAWPYIRALKNPNNEVVNRAAEALQRIGDRDAVGPLIDALVTKHKIVVGSGSRDQHAYAFTPSGGTAMNFGGGGAKTITQAVENPSVLTALTKLTGGMNFRYDQAAWRRWLAAEAKAHPIDIRRDL